MEGGSTPRGSGGKIAIVSGLNFSGTDMSYALELSLLLEYLLGEALDPAAQGELSHISRLIIAGNSIAPDDASKPLPTEGEDKKTHKKYGYDSSSYNPVPSQLLDGFLSELLPSMPITILPGQHDPANASFPQQPVHPAMYPKSRAFSAAPGAADPGWLDSVTNPWEGEVDGWRFLGTSGQNVDDVFKYVLSDDRLGMMELMCRWRCTAPTAPDTLCRYMPAWSIHATTSTSAANRFRRELPFSGRRSVYHEPVSPSLFCWLATRVRDQDYNRTRRPVGASSDSPGLLQVQRNCVGGYGDARCHPGQNIDLVILFIEDANVFLPIGIRAWALATMLTTTPLSLIPYIVLPSSLTWRWYDLDDQHRYMSNMTYFDAADAEQNRDDVGFPTVMD